jgi:hypothetical protein
MPDSRAYSYLCVSLFLLANTYAHKLCRPRDGDQKTALPARASVKCQETRLRRRIFRPFRQFRWAAIPCQKTIRTEPQAMTGERSWDHARHPPSIKQAEGEKKSASPVPSAHRRPQHKCQVLTEAESFLIPLPLSDTLLTRSHAAGEEHGLWTEWPNGYTVHLPTRAFKGPIKTGLAVRYRALNPVQIGRNCVWSCDRVSGVWTRIAAISHEFYAISPT